MRRRMRLLMHISWVCQALSSRIFSYAQTFAGLILSASRPNCQRSEVLQCIGAQKMRRVGAARKSARRPGAETPRRRSGRRWLAMGPRLGPRVTVLPSAAISAADGPPMLDFYCAACKRGRRASAASRSEPAGLAKTPVEDEVDGEHDPQAERIAVAEMQFRYVLKIHAVDAGDHRRHREQRGERTEPLGHFVLRE